MKTLWVFVGMFMVLSCASEPGSHPKIYSNFDKKCEISKLSFDNVNYKCYCKIMGTNERNDVIIFVPIPEKNCK